MALEPVISPSTMVGQYNATPVTVATANATYVQTDAQGRLLASPSGSAPVGGGITYTDKTITSATGSSQTIMAANASRKSIIVKNGASPTGVNILGSTAAIGGAATLTLQAYESMTLTGADCPLGVITVISTAAAYISALEGA